MEKLIPPDFLIVPYQLVADKNINPVDERVYATIYWFAKLKIGKCTASNESLAFIAQTTPQTIANSLNNLELTGYIARKYKDEAKRHRLEVIPLIGFGKIDKSTNVSDTPTGLTTDTPTGEQNKNNIIIKDNSAETSSAVSKDLILYTIQEYKKIKHFDEVKGWDKVHFPRHAKEAKQIIEMLRANFTGMEDEETKKEILRCLKEFVQWEKQTNLSWQLSTVVKKFGEYMADTLLKK